MNSSSDILNKLAGILGLPPHTLRQETTISELPEWDSMAQLAIMSMLEQDYAVAWNPDLFLNINTIEDIINIAEGKTSHTNSGNNTPDTNFITTDNRQVTLAINNKPQDSREYHLLQTLASAIGIDIKELHRGKILSDIPEWDSLASLAVAGILEQTYKISLSPEEFIALNTVDDIITAALGHNQSNQPLLFNSADLNTIDASLSYTSEPLPIVHSILKWADNTPTRNAIIFPGFSISYRQLARGILSTAVLLKEKGVKKGNILAIYAEKNPGFFYCYFAAHYLGAIVLNLDPSINKERLSYITAETHPVLTIGSKSNNDLNYEAITAYRATVIPERGELSPNDIADIMFTTGTTGGAKGVPLTHRNQTAAARQINAFIGTCSTDVEVVSLPIYHSFGLGRVRCLLSIGATVICVDGFGNTRELFTALSENKATGWAFVPAAWAYLQQTTGNLITQYAQNLRYIEIGSAPMPVEKKRELMELFPQTRICMHYGLTEASRSSFIEFHSESAYLQTAGKPSPNTEISIINENGTILEPLQEGEICIKGHHVMQSYLNSPDITSYYHGEFFRTGDWGLLDNNGYLHILSRTKDIINSGGKKISPEEVENMLLQLPGIKECACVAEADPNGILGEVVKAILVSDGTSKPDLTDIRKELTGKLENYKLPTLIEWRDRLPRTDSGKLKRNDLRH